MNYTLAELASHTGARLNDASFSDLVIQAVAPVQTAKAGDISFFADPRYKKHLGDCHASAVILSEELAQGYKAAALISHNPYATYARVAALITPADMPASETHASAVIHESAKIGPGCYIGPNTVIEADVVIEADCYLAAGIYIGKASKVGRSTRINANVSIYHDCVIGQRNIIHSSAVIGADGFGFANDAGEWIKVPQTGGVRLGDDVEVGASTTIDRGAIDDTIIGNGVKLDNQIQIAHNVRIGEHTAIAGCSGVAGSAVIGKHCTIAGMCTIVGHIELVDHVHITAMSLITKSIKKPGSYSSGTAFEDTASWRKNSVRFKQLDVMSRRLHKLENKS
ncbi:MAG: UDP-3-O-(3-hydroxymyristoyl)glucosamine N-acyltransferase [Gammaproteobacteria bacterium]|nr:UDP-3-O-(3-hydroxymyristoyl)glucosamine N-acyltransferase [Gammaproteobacteria bacterium]